MQVPMSSLTPRRCPFCGHRQLADSWSAVDAGLAPGLAHPSGLHGTGAASCCCWAMVRVPSEAPGAQQTSPVSQKAAFLLSAPLLEPLGTPPPET